MRVKEALENKVKTEGAEDVIGRIEVPVQQVKRIRGNKQSVHKRKLYPGYVFLEMESTEDGEAPEKAWFLIKETTGVGDFIGTDGVPTPMSDTDVAKMLNEAEQPEGEKPSINVEFQKGDQVKIKDGAFENFEGVVDSIDGERGLVKVIVTIFGRSTPLDIEYWQVEKI
jgi:transcriptional antiterminator NusG